MVNSANQEKKGILIFLLIILSNNFYCQGVLDFNYLKQDFIKAHVVKDKKIKSISIYEKYIEFSYIDTIFINESNLLYKREYTRNYKVSQEFLPDGFINSYFYKDNSDTIKVESKYVKDDRFHSMTDFYIDSKRRIIITVDDSLSIYNPSPYEKHYTYNELNDTVKVDVYDLRNRNSFIKKEFIIDVFKDTFYIIEHKVSDINAPMKTYYIKKKEKNEPKFVYKNENTIIEIYDWYLLKKEYKSIKCELLDKVTYTEIEKKTVGEDELYIFYSFEYEYWE